MVIMKKCIVCGVEKDLNEFPKKDKKTYRGKCKICHNERRREIVKMSEDEKKILHNNIKNTNLLKRNERDERIGMERIEKLKNKEEKRKQLQREKDENKRLKNKKLCKICGEVNEEMFYNRNKSRCKKCILSTPNTRYYLMNEDEKNDYKDKLKVWRGDNLIRVRVSGAKHRAVRKGIIFDITDDDIIDKLNEQDNKCYISKVPLSFNENDWYGMSLDRLDSNIGYTKENTIIVTKFVNISKNNLSLDEYIRLMKEVCDNI